MQKYEIMVILKSDLDEKEALQYAQDAVIGKIKELGGKVTFEDFWGARGFAYMIKKYKWGYYLVAQFDMAPGSVLELRRELNIDNKVLRQLIITVDKNAPAPRKYAEMKKEYEAAEKKAKKDQDEEEKKPLRREKLTTVKESPKETEDAQESAKAKEATSAKEEPKKDAVDHAIDKVLDDATADL